MIEGAFNQMQVQHNIDLNFASGVRALMRQDPDIIMVGEICDLETAEMAIQAALTGHLVLSTLHTNDAPSAITRLLELGVPHYLLKATILGVMAQRLVRTLCPHCKAPVQLDEDTWNGLTRPWSSPLPTHAHHAVGCLECRETGYRGRAGVYEIMLINDAIKPLITADTDLTLLRRAAFKDGMRSLRPVSYTHLRSKKLPALPRASFRQWLRAAREAFWGLLLMVIILGGIYSGMFTPTEAAAVAAVYAGFVALFVYKDLTIRECPKVLLESGKLTIMLMFIIANAMLFAHVLTTEQIPQQITA